MISAQYYIRLEESMFLFPYLPEDPQGFGSISVMFKSANGQREGTKNEAGHLDAAHGCFALVKISTTSQNEWKMGTNSTRLIRGDCGSVSLRHSGTRYLLLVQFGGDLGAIMPLQPQLDRICISLPLLLHFMSMKFLTMNRVC